MISSGAVIRDVTKLPTDVKARPGDMLIDSVEYGEMLPGDGYVHVRITGWLMQGETRREERVALELLDE